MKALFDTGTMRDNLISGKFVSSFQIATQDLDTPISLKMAVKGSHSTINYKCQPLIQMENKTDNKTDALVCSLDNYDILLGMLFLTANNAIIDYGNNYHLLPKTGNHPYPSARKKCALGEAAMRPDAANPPGTPRAPGASGYCLPRTVDAWCIQIIVESQLAAHCLLKGAFLCE